METHLILLVIFIFAIGSFVQSMVGFGMAIVAAPLLLIIEPALVPSTVTVVALCHFSVNAWQYRRMFSLKGLGWALLGRVPGTIAAGFLLAYISLGTLSIMMGITVLFAVVASVFKFHVAPSNKNMFWAGFVSGIMGTSTSIGGPPMALVLQHSEANKLRANLAVYFIASCILSLITLSITGHFTAWHFKYALLSLPAVFVASWLSFRVAPYMKSEWVRGGLLALCSFAGLITLYQGIYTQTT